MVVIFVFIRGPPYCIFGILINYDELVFWRTPCVFTSHDIDSTQFTYLSLFKTFQTRFGFFFE